MRHLFLFPTNSCPASCGYCFAPPGPSPVMGIDTLERSLGLFKALAAESGERGDLSVTFHGGEPLAAGKDFFRSALPMVRSLLGGSAHVSVQSNLWLLDHEYCDLFQEYRVGIGTSLDGPRDVNDAQRGEGYFDRTWAGLELLRRRGVEASCLATVTAASARRGKDIFAFFASEGISFDVHPAVKPLGADGGRFPVGADAFGDFLVELGELYRATPDRLKIGFIDSCARSVSRGKSGLCLFTKCLGDYLAVSPDGGLYPCNRFAGAEDFSLGSVGSVSSLADLSSSRGWKRIDRWFDDVERECAGCRHASVCRGGCPYAALAASPPAPAASSKDPSCEAYRRIYDWTVDKATEEFFEGGGRPVLGLGGRGAGDSPGVAEPGAAGSCAEASAGRPGLLISLASGYPHPLDLRRTAKVVLGARLLGLGEEPERIAESFAERGISDDAGAAARALAAMGNALRDPPPSLSSLYLHVTERCNLRCSHCYHGDSDGGPPRDLEPAAASDLARQAADLGFEKVSVTGGEPLAHPAFGELAERLASIKRSRGLPKMILRTNLAMELDDRTIEAALAAFDRIVVSLDGGEAAHDARRGPGSYRRTLGNLRSLAKCGSARSIHLSCAIDHSIAVEALESEKEAVIRVGEEIGAESVTFKPVLPLGRAAGRGACPSRAEDASTVAEWASQGRGPASSCGLGHSLMVDARGRAFPCHALAGTGGDLGNAVASGLRGIIESEAFVELRAVTVDAARECAACGLRYLCGGLCEVWKGEGCGSVKEALLNLVEDASEILGLSPPSSSDP